MADIMDTSEYRINHWFIDITSSSLINNLNGEQRRLGEYQLRLLQVLVQHAGKILTRDELTNMVWERRVIGNNSLPNAIHALRVALDDDGKQQRIIKTIPRKGYILEKEFCQYMKNESEKTTTDNEVQHTKQDEKDLHSNMRISVPCATIQGTGKTLTFNSMIEHDNPSSQWRKIFLGVCGLFTFLGLIITLFIMHHQHDVSFSIHNIQEDLYSNIELYQIVNDDSQFNGKDDLHEKIKNGLFHINQMLEKRQSLMQVYFHTSEPLLNYSLVIKNNCEKKQLAMNIYQWRINSEKTNNMIYEETEKVLNEMDSCVS
jgi:DNA-binding winged helix-turn-helix (wHTH) protein